MGGGDLEKKRCEGLLESSQFTGLEGSSRPRAGSRGTPRGVCVCLGGGGRGGRKLQIDMTIVLERGSQVSDTETQVRNKFGSRTETRRDESRTPRKSWDSSVTFGNYRGAWVSSGWFFF